jgi:hypothetical protein
MTPWGKGPLFGDTLAGRTSAKPTMDRDGTIHNCQRRASPQLLAPIVQRSNLSLCSVGGARQHRRSLALWCFLSRCPNAL